MEDQKFMNALQEIFNRQLTENQALGYRTTGNKLLDMEFKIPSYREDPVSLLKDFKDAFSDDVELAMRWAFHLRDVRGGVGERMSFRWILSWLSANRSDILKKVMLFIPYYGRWDDLISLISIPNTEISDAAIEIINEQLIADYYTMKEDGSISLLAKWLPSVDATNKEVRQLAAKIRKKLKLDKKYYKNMIKELRAYLDIVERKMSQNQWDQINYETVPSRANLLYSDAFLKHDYDRRSQYLKDVAEGKSKMHASTLYPYEIVHRYSRGYGVNHALEGLWKGLASPVDDLGSIMVVRDGSGSMYTNIGNTAACALDVSTALAIYASERAKPPYKDKFITFSEKPQFVDLSDCDTLYDKLSECYQYDHPENTNLVGVFQLILRVALDSKCTQEELPSTVLVISDMEFDSATGRRDEDTLMNYVSSMYANHGYKLPKLAFWNVLSRTNTIPMKENDNGLVLVSGFSAHTFNMVISQELDPVKVLISELMSERYDPVGSQIK